MIAPADSTSTVAEVAAYYRVGAHTVLTWIGSGELEAENVAAKKATRPLWRISPEALEKFAAARRNRPALKVAKVRLPAGGERVKQFFKP